MFYDAGRLDGAPAPYFWCDSQDKTIYLVDPKQTIANVSETNTDTVVFRIRVAAHIGPRMLGPVSGWDGRNILSPRGSSGFFLAPSICTVRLGSTK